MALNISLDILNIMDEYNNSDRFSRGVDIAEYLCKSYENDVIDYLEAVNKKNIDKYKYTYFTGLFKHTKSQKVSQYIIDNNWNDINFNENIIESLKEDIEYDAKYQWKLEMAQKHTN